MISTPNKLVSFFLLGVLSLWASCSFAISASESEALLKEMGRLDKVIAYNLKALEKTEGEDKQIAGLRLLSAGGTQRLIVAQLVEYAKVDVANNDALRKRIKIEIPELFKKLKHNFSLIETSIENGEKARDESTDQVDTLMREQQVLRANMLLDDHFEGMFENISYMPAFSIDDSDSRSFLISHLNLYTRIAADRLELINLAVDDLEHLMDFGDVAVIDELKSKLSLLAHKKSGSIENLSRRVVLLESLQQDTTEYTQLLLTSTGEISGDLLGEGVLTGLFEQSMAAIYEWFSENGVELLWKVILFLLILFVFRALSNVVKRLVANSMNHSSLSMSVLLKDFFIAMSSKVVMLIGLLIALSQLGIEVGPLLAGFGMVGLVIGFALQDTLSNFASGMMILIYRPFDEGDLIEIAGLTGTVSKLSLVSTTVLTLDNQCLVVPNSKIWGDVIRNVTAQNMRRIDMVFGIGYSDDIPHAEEVLTRIVNEHPKVLKNPEAMVKLHTLNESSVDFVVRPWVETKDYWDVYWDITKAVKQGFDAEGISIPFPQRDVHLYQTAIAQKE